MQGIPYAMFIPVIIFCGKIMVELYTYFYSDYVIREFYSPTIVKIIYSLLKPLFPVIINFIFTLILFIYVVFGYILKVSVKRFLVELKNPSSLVEKSYSYILTICLFVAFIQFIFFIILDKKRNEHLVIKPSKIFLDSNTLNDKFDLFPSDTKIYISQFFSKDFLLVYYFENKTPIRHILPKKILTEFPIKSEKRESIITDFSEFNNWIISKKYGVKIVTFSSILTIPLIYIITKSIITAIFILIELLIIFYPIVKLLAKKVQNTIKKQKTNN